MSRDKNKSVLEIEDEIQGRFTMHNKLGESCDTEVNELSSNNSFR